jgi:hypothetical protein
MRRWIGLAAAALVVLGGCSVVGGLPATRCPSSRKLVAQEAADYIDFVQVGGITYHAGIRPAAGRGLRERDLGAQVAAVRCRLDGHLPGEPGQLDGDAAYLDKGIPLFAVRGYRPSFRLAARRDGRLVLYEAADNPRARTWADLLDIGGRVRSIGIEGPSGRPRGAIGDPGQVARLVELLLASPTGPPAACGDERFVFLQFRLRDGTATALPYGVDSGRLECRDPLPPAFAAAIRPPWPDRDARPLMRV